MLAQNALHQPTEIGANVLTKCPVDRDVAAYSRDQLTSNASQGLVAELCLLFIHPRAPNLISLRSAGTMPA